MSYASRPRGLQGLKPNSHFKSSSKSFLDTPLLIQEWQPPKKASWQPAYGPKTSGENVLLLTPVCGFELCSYHLQSAPDSDAALQTGPKVKAQLRGGSKRTPRLKQKGVVSGGSTRDRRLTQTVTAIRAIFIAPNCHAGQLVSIFSRRHLRGEAKQNGGVASTLWLFV